MRTGEIMGERFNLLISERMGKQVEQIALSDGINKSEWIRRVVQKELDRRAKGKK